MKKFLPNKKGFFAFLLALSLGMGTAYAVDFSAVCNGKTLYFNVIDESNHYVEITYPGAWNNHWGGFDQPTGNITLPSSVTFEGVFYTVTKIGDFAFDQCTGMTGSLTIPSSVTTIGICAFNGCTGFDGLLTIPSSVTMIDDLAFYGCSGFTGSLTIPDSVTTIGSSAFHFCSGFNGSLTLSNSLTEINDFAFYECAGLTGSLSIPSGVVTIGDYAFCSCESFTGSLTIPSSVTSIGNFAFAGCSCTGSLILPNALTTIGDHAFFNCDGFTGSLTIPNSVNTIGEMTFAYCDGFSGTLTIGKFVTSLGLDTFKDCTGFTQLSYNAINCDGYVYEQKEHTPFQGNSWSLSIGDGVQRIPSWMFYDCGITGTLFLPSSVTSIGDGAFSTCTGLNSIYLGNSLTTIGTYAFEGCSGITGKLTIPDSVTTMGIYAFAYCTSFSSLVIGSSVSAIGYGAFYHCDNLGSITVHRVTPPFLAADVFYNVPKTIPVYVPCNAMDAYQAASGWSEFTSYQCIPWKVTLSANPWGAGYVDFTDSNGEDGNYADGAMCTVLATPHDGYQFMHWVKNGDVVSSNTSYSFNVYSDTELEAVFVSQSDLGTIIGTGTNSSMYLPSYSFYKYSLTEQIYTSEELDGISTITSISFFNTGNTKTRTYNIYMKHTDRTSFSGNSDWISVISTDLVYSGSVTMRSGMWTTIMLDSPFVYNGTSNLVLVVDDNTGGYTNSPHMACRTYGADGNQALRIYSDGTNYDPSSPSSYSGTSMSVKNQIMLNRSGYNIAATSANSSAGTVTGGGWYGQGDQCRLKATPNTGYKFLDWTDETGLVISTVAEYTFFVTESRTLTAHFLQGTDVCSLTFDLYDSYGDGWNGNYLVVGFEDGPSQRLTISEEGFEASYTLPVLNGSHVELSWIQGNWASECFFKVSYSNGNLAFASVGANLDASFAHGFDVDCDEKPATWVFLGYDDNGGSEYLPSYSYYNYSLTQQIYSADEIGSAGLITSIAFYNEGSQTKTRTYDIYMKATGKYEFASNTDWIGVTEGDKVFSGQVTMTAGKWTLITFDTPFDYNGTSNVVLVVDDNTGGWTSAPHMSCRTFDADGNQAIQIYSDGTDYDPSSPSAYSGTLMDEKNQVYLGIVTTCPEPTDLMVTNITTTSALLNWTGLQDDYSIRYRTVPSGPWIETEAHLGGALGSFMDGFENGLGNWTLIDADGDGFNWLLHSSYSVGGVSPHGGGDMAISESWTRVNDVGTVLYPDNYLVSPQVTFAMGSTVSFWACAEDDQYPAEHFGIAVSTGSNTAPDDFTLVQEWTMTAKGERHGGPRGMRNQGTWYQYSVDLSAYAGQTGYIAIRHFNCSDQFVLAVDDFTYGGTESGITLDGLNPGTTYEVQVQGMCSFGPTEWSESVTFTTESLILTQTSNLSSGWNWWSTYLDITLNDLKAALVEALPGATIMISSQNSGSTTYNGTNWRGTLNALDVTQMYKIKTSADGELVLTGEPLVPAEHPITINPGVNWIGFPLDENMSLNNAFVGFAVSGDMVRAQNGSSTYNGSTWRGNFNTLEPGHGYIYKSTSSVPRMLVIGAPPDPHEYVDLGLPSGLLWATCNVGADSPEEYGDYFAWGETQPKDYYECSTYLYYHDGDESQLTKYCTNAAYGYNGFVDNQSTLLPEDDAATVNWGSNWRMPTEAEWEELFHNTPHIWTTQNGVVGMLFTASNGNSIFFPAAGSRRYDDLFYEGENSSNWASSIYTDPRQVWSSSFSASHCDTGHGGRFWGRPVRAVRVMWKK